MLIQVGELFAQLLASLFFYIAPGLGWSFASYQVAIVCQTHMWKVGAALDVRNARLGVEKLLIQLLGRALIDLWTIA